MKIRVVPSLNDWASVKYTATASSRCSIQHINGCYQFSHSLTEPEVILLARSVLKKKIFNNSSYIYTKEDVVDLLKMQLHELGHEEMWCLFLSTDHRVLAFEKMFNGTINQCSVYPREIVKRTLQLNAANVILAHNHPSGNVSASSFDQIMTKQLQEALKLIDVEILDHFIVSGGSYFSFCENGYL